MGKMQDRTTRPTSKTAETRVLVHSSAGGDSFTLGRDRFAKISAIEGITPSKEAKARARDFDRRGLTPAERRNAIIDAFRSKG
jgi:hypothetical protein